MKYSLGKMLFASLCCLFPYIMAGQGNVADSLMRNTRIPFQYIQADWQYTGARSTIKSEDMKSFTSNVANTLYGLLPGLTVQQGGGEPGSDMPTLNIRGLSTFDNGKILIVIDGMPSSDVVFRQLTPQEIESISVLKDAAATIIYGQRAANGVLVVETKRGKEGPMQLEVSGQWGFQSIPRTPDFLGSYDYATLYNEAYMNDYGTTYYTAEQLDAYRTGSNPLYYPDVNWYDELLRSTSLMQNYNLSARGGSQSANYFVALNVLGNGGMYKRTADFSDITENQSYMRYNFRTNLDIQLTRRLAAFVTFGGAIEDKTTPGVSETTNDVFYLMGSVAPNAFPVSAGDDMPGGSAMYRNPWAEITQRGYTSYNARTTQSSVKLTGDLGFWIEGLSISAAVGINTNFKSYSSKTGDYMRYSVSPGADGPVYTSYGQDSGGLSGSETNSYQWRNYIIQGDVDYNNVFGKHTINSKLTFYYDDTAENNNYGAGADTMLPYVNIGMGGNVSYAYDQRYVAEFTFGYSGNNNFLRGKRFGFFPAGSLAWIVSNESFLKDNDVLDFMKVRASYGLTGNNNIGGSRFMYNQLYNWGNYNMGTDNSSKEAYIQGTLANPDATWEKEKQLNIGLELTLWKSFDIHFDYFIKDRYDILAQPYSTVPDFLGGIVPYMNVGKVNNKGFELSVRYAGGSEKNFSYYLEGGAWFAQNKVMFNAEAPKMYDYLYGTGHRIGQPFGLEAIGFFADQADIDASPEQIFTQVQPGDVKYANWNDDDVIDTNDEHAIGYTSMPELTLSLRPGIKYKGFYVDMLFQAGVNRSVYWTGRYFHAFQNNGKVSSVAWGRWTPETAATATYPRLSASDNLNNYRNSTLWLKNGNFLTLRNLEIGYSLPEKWMRKIKIEETRIFLNGTNLFSLDHMQGMMDPEDVNGGLGYPVLRTLSLGLNIQL